MSRKFTVEYKRSAPGSRVVVASVYWDGRYIQSCAHYWSGRSTRIYLEPQIRAIRMAFLVGREDALGQIKEWAA